MNEEEGANFIFIHSSINEIGVGSESEFQAMNSPHKYENFLPFCLTILSNFKQKVKDFVKLCGLLTISRLYQAFRKEGNQIRKLVCRNILKRIETFARLV